MRNCFCNNNYYYDFVDFWMVDTMIPPLKVRCKRQWYQKGGTCMFFVMGHRVDFECLKYNCIYFDGERK